jgi:hypothetical protein
VHRVVALIGEEQLGAGAAGDAVVAEAADHRVRAAGGVDGVVAAVAENEIGAAARQDRIGALAGVVAPDQRLGGAEAAVSIVSAPSLPNSCIEPLLPPAMMQSFSVPPCTVPVLPAWRMTVSLPESPVTVASPVPVAMLSSPARPMMVPGPVSPVWFSTSFPAVPVAW